MFGNHADTASKEISDTKDTVFGDSDWKANEIEAQPFLTQEEVGREKEEAIADHGDHKSECPLTKSLIQDADVFN